MFVGAQDKYILRDDPDKKEGMTASTSKKGKSNRMIQSSGSGGFDTIGTDRESAPLLMSEYMSYDEMKISALLATCSPTSVINDGDRKNRGTPMEDKSKFVE